MRGYLFKTPYILKKLYPDLVWDKSGNSTNKEIYLTFDDGPIPEVTPWVLDVLDKYEVQATFFMVGDNVLKHPEIFKEVLSAGHSIGNHTFNHLNGWKTATDIYLKNIKDCSQILIDSGVKSTLFRPPYGKIRRDQIAALKDSYEIIMWDYLTGDFDPNLSVENVIKNFKRKIINGSIVVFHDNIKSFAVLKETLPDFLNNFKNRGYIFKTL